MKKIFLPLLLFLLCALVSLSPRVSLAYANTTPIDAGYNSVIITDSSFTNSNTMTEGDIQYFLNTQVSSCDTWHPNTIGGGEIPPWTCLKDYVDPAGHGTAARIILTEAIRNGLNPQVLLVTLQKENSLITDNWPFQSQYNTAMGYGCFESTPGECSSYGFYNQVRYGAMLLRSAFDRSCGYANYGSYPDTWGENPALRRGNTTPIDGRPTYIGSCATGSLYNYTSHRPDSAWLTAASDGSYYYGNYNFVNYMNKWFFPYRYAFVSATNPPTTMYKGQIATAQIRLMNSGTATWYGEGTSNPFRLLRYPYGYGSFFSTWDTTWVDNTQIKMVEASVSPGQIATFNVTYVGNAPPGTHLDRWVPFIVGQGPLNDIGMGFRVTVNPYYQYAFASAVNPPSTMAKGQVATGQIRLINTGSRTWYGEGTSNPFRLLRYPYGYGSFFSTWDTTWVDNTQIKMVEASVSPGQIATFNVTYVGNAPPGTHLDRWVPFIVGQGPLNDIGMGFRVTVQ